MNRRSFISAIAQAAVAFTILPSALTYERKWRKNAGLWIDTEYRCVMQPPPHCILKSEVWQIVYDFSTDRQEWTVLDETIPEGPPATDNTFVAVWDTTTPAPCRMSYEEFTKLRKNAGIARP